MPSPNPTVSPHSPPIHFTHLGEDEGDAERAMGMRDLSVVTAQSSAGAVKPPSTPDDILIANKAPFDTHHAAHHPNQTTTTNKTNPPCGDATPQTTSQMNVSTYGRKRRQSDADTVNSDAKRVKTPPPTKPAPGFGTAPASLPTPPPDRWNQHLPPTLPCYRAHPTPGAFLKKHRLRIEDLLTSLAHPPSPTPVRY
jgi:hypothetical protein